MHLRKKGKANIVAGILLLWIIIAVPSIIISQYANHLIVNKIHINNANFLYSTYMSVDSELSAAYAKVDGLFEKNSADYYTLLNAENLNNADATLALSRLYNDFKTSQLNNGFFENTFLYFPKSQLVISSEGSYSAEFFFGKTMIFEDYENDYFEKLTQKQFSSVFCPATSILKATSADHLEVSHTSVIPVAIKPSDISSSQGIAVVLINEEKMNAFFERLNTDRSSFIYLQDIESGKILNSPSEVKYERKLQLDSQDYRGKSQSFQLKKEKEQYSVFWRNSAVNKLRYICVEPELLISRQIRTFTYLTLLISGCALLLSAVILGVYSRYLHKNISDMLIWLKKASYGKEEVGEKQAFLNIPDLKEAVEILCSQHENSRPYLIYSFLGRSVKDILTEEDYSYFKKEFPEFGNDNYFRIYMWKVKVSGETDELSNGFMEKLDQFGYVVNTEGKDVYVLFMAAETKEELQEREQKLSEYGYDLTEGKGAYICGRSEIFRDIKGNYRCYHQVQTLLNYYGVGRKKNIYDIQDILNTEEDILITARERKQIVQLLKNSSESAVDYIKEILVRMRQNNISFYQYRLNVKELLYILQENMYEQQIPFMNIFSSEGKILMEKLDEAFLSEELDRLCLETYSRIPDSNIQKEVVDQAEQTLLNYINDNLAEINLTILADVTGMNQNYLSQYFKKHFGISFLDYVTGKKIEKAKELLVNTDYTCKAIGEMLGYSAQNVFIRAFKKSESVTPAEYRQKERSK